MKTLQQIKTEATQREHRRVFDNMSLPPRDIEATDPKTGASWIKRAWTALNRFGWGRWELDR
jgi:hypothetical protein